MGIIIVPSLLEHQLGIRCWFEQVLLVFSFDSRSDKVAVESAARTVWVPLLRRRRLASLERPEQVEGGCHFLWLLSDDCVSVKERVSVCDC